MYSLEELMAAAKPRPTTHGVVHMHCIECTAPGIDIQPREDGNFVLMVNADVYIYLSREQLEHVMAEIDTRGRAALDV